ncbi:MAG: histidine kinase [Candidatus Aminicenantes bacterium]|nr:MAG: histidine kinase [Candidatus Aminicenantes bacterium]
MTSKLEKLIIVLVFLAAYYGILYHPTLPVFINEFNTVDGSIYASRFVDVCLSLTLFLSVVFILIPKYLEKRRIFPFIAVSLAMIGVLSLLEFQLDQIILRLFNLPSGPDEISDKMFTFYRRKSYDFPIIPVNLVIYTLGILYGLSRDWIRKYRHESKMIQEKMRADIDFLRSQINPHFFFNALNNIYSITQRNRDHEAGQAIMKLSGLMRYMIYDSNVAEISLARELEHIDNYLEVARLKFDKNDKLEIRLQREGNFHNYKIAPLLLVPFVENAFKHGVGNKGDGYIHLSLFLSDGELCFRIENPILEKEESWKKHPGIGLGNVKKRLQILYPDRHQLNISDTEGKFKVQLTIRFEE